MSQNLPVGVLLRRARQARGLSQRDLAQAAGVSQAAISYYERGRVQLPAAVLAQLKRALDLPSGELDGGIFGLAAPPHPLALEELGLNRTAFLKSLASLPEEAAMFDRPAGNDGGDLAFAVDLRSHVFLVVIDAQGSGAGSAILARVAAACAFGVIPSGGVPQPEDIVDATLRFWSLLGASPRSASLCAVCFERRTRRIRQCRLSMPPPFLRSGRLFHWTGKPDGPGGAHVAETTLESNALLVIATDGVANLATKGERVLWKAPELRTLLNRATESAQVVEMFESRAGAASRGTRTDDRLAIAVML